MLHRTWIFGLLSEVTNHLPHKPAQEGEALMDPFLSGKHLFDSGFETLEHKTKLWLRPVAGLCP